MANTTFAQGQQSPAVSQARFDDKELRNYFAKHHIQAEKTASGLYYAIKEPGTGPTAKPGQQVSVKYLGTLLNGKKFDANVDENFNCSHPLTFVLGMHQVIPGWDEGLSYFREGTRGTLYIPSGLAYGERYVGKLIPANSILIFEVELLDIDN